MRTRSGTLYPKTSMAIDATELSNSNPTSSPPSRNQKRKRRSAQEASLMESALCNLFLGSQARRFAIERSRGGRFKLFGEKDECCKRMRISYESRSERTARKRCRNLNSSNNGCQINFFDSLPDDLLIVIMSKVSASADSASDIINARLTYDFFLSSSVFLPFSFISLFFVLFPLHFHWEFYFSQLFCSLFNNNTSIMHNVY